jgi:arylsulfatase A-like enzyme
MAPTRLLTALLAALLLAACQPAPPPAPSNLVVICLDTVRYDAFIERDVTDELTPWLAQAQQYQNASSTAPWTMPGVSSLLTGLYPIEHGAGRFTTQVANLDEEVPSRLDETITTLAEILDQQFFRTGAFVSHPFFNADLGLRQGFQQVHNRRGWWRDVERFWEWADRFKEPARFFGYLHFMEAHHRHTQGNGELDEFLGNVDPARLDYLAGLHPENCRNRDSRRCRQNLVYDASVLELRTAVATVLNDLQDRDLLDDTLVLVYSDHGEEFWDHEAIQLEQNHDPRRHTGLGHGQSLYEELLHVPLLAWHPGLEGAVHPDPVSLVDVVPSVAAWLGLNELELEVSGQPLPPLANNGPDAAQDRLLFASGIAYGPEQVAVRKGMLKSIFHIVSDRFEIYDLVADPGESQGLTDQGLSFEFDTLTGDYLEMPSLATSSEGRLAEGQLEELKAIGYLQGVEEETDGERPQEEDQ